MCQCICTHKHACVYIHSYKRVCMYVCITHQYLCVYIYYARVHVHMLTSIHTYTYIHTYTHTYIHTYIQPYMHTCIPPSVRPSIHPSIHACMHAYTRMYAIYAIMHTQTYAARLAHFPRTLAEDLPCEGGGSRAWRRLGSPAVGPQAPGFSAPAWE